MSVAKAVVTIPDERYSWVAGNKYFVLGTVAIDASPATYAAGGLVMSLLAPLVKASRAPLFVSVVGQAGYIYRYVPGTDASNGKLMIFEQSGVDDTPLDEYDDTVAIAAAVSGDTIVFEALFHGQL